MKPTSDRDEIFERLEGALRRHVPPFAARTGSVRDKRDLHLWSEREVVAGRQRNEVVSSGAIVQKAYVGLPYRERGWV